MPMPLAPRGKAVNPEQIPDGIVVVDRRIAGVVDDRGEATEVVVGVVRVTSGCRARRQSICNRKNAEEPKATQLHNMAQGALLPRWLIFAT